MIQDETTTLLSAAADSSSALLLPSHSQQQQKQGGSESKSGLRRRPFVLFVGVLFCLVAVIVLAQNKGMIMLRSLTGTGVLAGKKKKANMKMIASLTGTGGTVRTGRNQFQD